jgi:hypothetical protein
MLCIKNIESIFQGTTWVQRIPNVLRVTWFFIIIIIIIITDSMCVFIAPYFKATSCLSNVTSRAIVTI